MIFPPSLSTALWCSFSLLLALFLLVAWLVLRWAAEEQDKPWLEDE